MRRIIGALAYDTKTAELIHEWSSGHYTNDFHRLEETLYRTEAGAFFVHGEGGALTAYATHHGDTRGAGSAITPLTDSEAREWLETHNAPAGVIEALFDVEEA